MKNRFNAENPLALNFDVKMTNEARNAFYFIANLMYNDYTEDEVQNIFSNPKLLADDIGDMLNEFCNDDDNDYKKAVVAISCVLLKQFGK